MGSGHARGLSAAGLSDRRTLTRIGVRSDRLNEQLKKAGVAADAIHGLKSQSTRQQSFAACTSSKVRVFVATDIAARGIDVDDISHVINFELPTEPESYIHRIGCAARAGSEDIALSFCDASERGQLKPIERTVRQSIPVDVSHAYHGKVAMSVGKAGDDAPRGKQHSRRNSGRPWVLKPRAAYSSTSQSVVGLD